MTTPQQQRPAVGTQTQTGVKPKSEFEILLEKKSVEYKPFMAETPIRLTVRMVMDYLTSPTKNGAVAQERDCVRFIMMCKARGLDPFEGDAFLVGYDTYNGPQFSLITAHQAFLKRAEVHKEYDGMESGIVLHNAETGEVYDREGDFYLPGEKVVGGWARVHFKNRKVPTYRRVRMERFNTNRAEWVKDAAGMICKCAEADALRSSFPTMLGGLYNNEEMTIAGESPARPIYEQPATALFAKASVPEESKTQEPAGEKEPGDDGDLGPQPKQTPAPEEKKEKPPTLLVAVRNLCKLAKIKEGVLLGYLAETGATDGSVSSLEELAMSNTTLLQSVHDKFAEMAAKIHEAMKDPRRAEQ